MKRFYFTCIVMLLTISLCLVSCADHETVGAEKLVYDGTDASPVSAEPLKVLEKKSLQFSQADFTFDLFKSVAENKEGENIIFSPLSVQLALAIAANGADGETAEQMLEVLGDGCTVEKLNSFLSAAMERMSADDDFKMKISNSIWFRDKNFNVNNDFLRIGTQDYNAEIYEAPFDRRTVKDINNWVKDKTDGMVEKIIEEFDENSIMCLINAIAFEADWLEPYYEFSITDETFTSYGGEKRSVEVMHGSEYTYLSDVNAKGFLKSYKGGKYSFAALLPDEGVDIYDYVDSLTADGMQQVLKGEKQEVITVLPKFSFDFNTDLSKNLKDMGMPLAFDYNNSDFSKLGTADDNIYIGKVLHNAHISVNEKGTRAGAATLVEFYGGAALDEEEPKKVVLDRPFVYMIIENETMMPVFIGMLCDIAE